MLGVDNLKRDGCLHVGSAVTAVRSQVSDGMRIDWDVPIPMDDGVVIHCGPERPSHVLLPIIPPKGVTGP